MKEIDVKQIEVPKIVQEDLWVESITTGRMGPMNEHQVRQELAKVFKFLDRLADDLLDHSCRSKDAPLPAWMATAAERQVMDGVYHGRKKKAPSWYYYEDIYHFGHFFGAWAFQLWWEHRQKEKDGGES